MNMQSKGLLETATDEAVARLRAALARHSLYLPGLSTDTITTSGVYFVALGGTRPETVLALAEALDRAPVA